MSTIVSAKRSRLAALAARSMQGAVSKPQLAVRNITARAVKEPASGRQYVLLKIETDGGPVGWGETAIGMDAATIVARLATFRSLVGRDALASQTIDAHLVQSGAPSYAR